MLEPLADQALRKINEAQGLYYRLIALVVSLGGGKTLQHTKSRRNAGFFCVVTTVFACLGFLCDGPRAFCVLAEPLFDRSLTPNSPNTKAAT
jgi:hypothetical protein